MGLDMLAIPMVTSMISRMVLAITNGSCGSGGSDMTLSVERLTGTAGGISRSIIVDRSLLGFVS